jgi:hypothetical protein
MLLQEDDIKLIYRALRAYKAVEKEKHLRSVLTEAFEEVLVGRLRRQLCTSFVVMEAEKTYHDLCYSVPSGECQF